jgi:hypothetical protein
MRSPAANARERRTVMGSLGVPRNFQGPICVQKV